MRFKDRSKKIGVDFPRANFQKSLCCHRAIIQSMFERDKVLSAMEKIDDLKFSPHFPRICELRYLTKIIRSTAHSLAQSFTITNLEKKLCGSDVI